jgi:predicted phosphodiesterase
MDMAESSRNDARPGLLAFLGDIHGSAWALVRAAAQAREAGAVALIQVGDFGWSERMLGEMRKLLPYGLPLPVYAIDGNHEDYAWLNASGAEGRLSSWAFGNHHLTYVPRGVVLAIGDSFVAFLGGAESVDKAIRVKSFGRHGGVWYPDERITPEQEARLDTLPRCDVLVTHTPPASTIAKHFDPADLWNYFGVDPRTWTDPSADAVERVWTRLGKPPLYCGHMHRHVEDDGVTILNIDELSFAPAHV